MSKILKRPKSYLKMGNPHARIIKAARQIHSQAELDALVAQAVQSGVEKSVIAGWLEATVPHLPFTPELSGESQRVVG